MNAAGIKAASDGERGTVLRYDPAGYWTLVPPAGQLRRRKQPRFESGAHALEWATSRPGPVRVVLQPSDVVVTVRR